MAAYPGFIGSSYSSQAITASAERTLNWYVELLRREHPSAKTPAALYPTPGVTTFAEAPAGIYPGRGLFQFEGRVFAAIGDRWYELNQAGTLTEIGNILQDAEPVSIQTNGDLNSQVLIASSGKLFSFDLTTTALSDVAGMSSGVRMVDYLDGYFFALVPGTSTIHVANLGTTIFEPLRIRERSLAPDRWQAMIVPKGSADVWAFGSLTTDILYNTGIAPVPIAPRPGLKIPWGIRAPRSAATLGGAPIWLGQNHDGGDLVLHADGYLPRRISTHAMELALRKYATTRDAVGWTYQQDGHTFYVLSFGAAGATWCYDAATPGQWHERDYLDPVTGQSRAWRPSFHVEAFGKHLTLDRESGKVLELDLDVFTDVDGSAIVRERIAPTLQAPNRGTVFLHQLLVDFQRGVGTNATGQGHDPVASLQVSHDGGQTWGPSTFAKIGKLGEYGGQVAFTRLGSGHDCLVRLRVSDPIAARVLGADLHATVGGR